MSLVQDTKATIFIIGSPGGVQILRGHCKVCLCPGGQKREVNHSLMRSDAHVLATLVPVGPPLSIPPALVVVNKNRASRPTQTART